MSMYNSNIYLDTTPNPTSWGRDTRTEEGRAREEGTPMTL
jgi:hypothetical protein